MMLSKPPNAMASAKGLALSACTDRRALSGEAFDRPKRAGELMLNACARQIKINIARERARISAGFQTWRAIVREVRHPLRV
jgi:hypothetical protein